MECENVLKYFGYLACLSFFLQGIKNIILAVMVPAYKSQLLEG